jgi:hypothetical protein
VFFLHKDEALSYRQRDVVGGIIRIELVGVSGWRERGESPGGWEYEYERRFRSGDSTAVG